MPSKGDKTRDQIIAAAGRLFYERGFAASSFADLAAAAGLPKGNFYFHFKTKEALLAAVIEDRRARFADLLQGWERSFATPQDCLKRATAILLAEAADVTRYGCPMGSLIAELGKSHPEAKNHLAAMLKLQEDWAANQITRIGLDPDRAREKARDLVMGIQGAAMLANAHADRSILEAAKTRLDRDIDNLQA